MRRKHTEQTKLKISLAKRNIPNLYLRGKKLSEEHKAKLRGKRPWAKHCGERLIKLGFKTRFKKGHKHSEEIKQKLRLVHLGKKRKPLSLETKKKISQANKGKKRSLEQIKKMSLVLRGRKVVHSLETRLKISLSKYFG